MRNVERIPVGGILVTVSELRVSDIRELIAGAKAETLEPAIVQHCISHPIHAFSDAQFAEINAAFERVNRAFYRPGKATSAALDPVKQLDESCIKLIERGHVHVFDYGWGFYITCINNLANGA